ncbi:protein of unknown function [Pseudomonas sp. JV241A]|nr:protein of unknown function [Pseudomonas sp. JV241A]
MESGMLQSTRMPFGSIPERSALSQSHCSVVMLLN